MSSREIVVATPIATRTVTPRLSAPAIAATTTPVITLIIGSARSSRQRSGRASISALVRGVDERLMSINTGRIPASIVRWWRIAP